MWRGAAATIHALDELLAWVTTFGERHGHISQPSFSRQRGGVDVDTKEWPRTSHTLGVVVVVAALLQRGIDVTECIDCPVTRSPCRHHTRQRQHVAARFGSQPTHGGNSLSGGNKLTLHANFKFAQPCNGTHALANIGVEHKMVVGHAMHAQ